MSELLIKYLPILIFIFVAFSIAVAMMSISFIFGSNKPDSENYHLMNVVLKHLMMQEVDLM